MLFVDGSEEFSSLFELDSPEIFDDFEGIFDEGGFLCYLVRFAHLFD